MRRTQRKRIPARAGYFYILIISWMYFFFHYLYPIIEKKKIKRLFDTIFLCYNKNIMIPEHIQITIGTLQGILALAGIVLGIGITFGILKNSVDTIVKKIDNLIEPDLRDMRERFGGIESKVDTLWKDRYAPASSPRQLNEQGQEILQKSGIKEMIDGKKEELTNLVKQKNPQNAYDAEKAILATMQEFSEHYPALIDQLKNGAFQAGADIDGVLFVGGIYLRELIFPVLGFSPGDIDNDERATPAPLA